MLTDFLAGKKTYIGLFVTFLAMATGIEISEGQLTMALDQINAIIAAVGQLIALYGYIVTKRGAA